MEKTGGKRLKLTLEKVSLKENEIIDTYNKTISKNGIVPTIQVGIDFRNMIYVVVKNGKSN